MSKNNNLGKFREPDLTLEQFAEKHKIEPIDIKCASCKKKIKVSDYYVTKDAAVLSYAHKKCENNLLTFVPISKANKEKLNLLFKKMSEFE